MGTAAEPNMTKIKHLRWKMAKRWAKDNVESIEGGVFVALTVYFCCCLVAWRLLVGPLVLNIIAICLWAGWALRVQDLRIWRLLFKGTRRGG